MLTDRLFLLIFTNEAILLFAANTVLKILNGDTSVHAPLFDIP